MQSQTAPPQQAAEMMQSFGTRHFVQYIAVLHSPRGDAVSARLKADPRIAALDGSMLTHGNGAISYSFTNLCLWFLWLEDKVGPPIAAQYLEEFLTQNLHPTLAAQWVIGIRAAHTIPLGNGFEIRPVSAMPPSQEQEHFSRVPGPLQYHESILPKCAITKECKIAVVQPKDRRELSPELLEVQKKLSRIPLIINAIEGLSCLPHFSTTYAALGVPNGPFSGSGGGIAGFDVIGSRIDEMTDQHARQLVRLIEQFEAKSQAEQIRLELILHRLCQAKRHERLEDKILDLGVSLEMLLLNDNKALDQLSLSFRLRGSWLLGKDPEDRRRLFALFRDIYDARSQAAHTGQVRLKQTKSVRRDEQLSEWLNLCCRVLQQILINGTPDWTKLVLGGEDKGTGSQHV